MHYTIIIINNEDMKACSKFLRCIEVLSDIRELDKAAWYIIIHIF